MKKSVARLNISFFLLFLLERQALAQTPVLEPAPGGREPLGEPSTVGRIPLPETANSLDRDLLSDPDGVAGPILDESGIVISDEARKLEISHGNGYRSALKETGQFFDQATFLYSHQAPSILDTRALHWDLGISSDYGATVGTQIREERQWGINRPFLELALNGRAYKGDGASLDEIFQGSSRTGRDFVEYDAPESSRRDGAVRLGDQIRLGRMSSLSLSGEYRQDRYEIKDDLDEGSRYESGGALWKLAFSREQSLETSFQRSVVRYDDDKRDFQVGQDLNEASTQLLQKIASRYDVGVGVRTLDGERTGPILSLVRRPDERGQARLQLSYLSGDNSHQLLGSLEGAYRLSRQSSVTYRFAQDVDLLASYNSNTDASKANIRNQTMTRSYELSARHEEKLAVWTLALSSYRQDYQTSDQSQAEARLGLEQRISTMDALSYSAGLKHLTEEGQVQRVIDRRGAVAVFAWKHSWWPSPRALGVRFYSQLAAGYERLWEGDKERERKTLSLALGQEWL